LDQLVLFYLEDYASRERLPLPKSVRHYDSNKENSLPLSRL
jgi:hypothetical protein